MAKYVMALDQGTTSSRCILFDKKGNMLGVFDKTYDVIGFKEQQIYDFIKKRLE